MNKTNQTRESLGPFHLCDCIICMSDNCLKICSCKKWNPCVYSNFNLYPPSVQIIFSVLLRNPHSSGDCLSFSNSEIYIRGFLISIRNVKDNYSLLEKEQCFKQLIQKDYTVQLACRTKQKNQQVWQHCTMQRACGIHPSYLLEELIVPNLLINTSLAEFGLRPAFIIAYPLVAR